MKKYLAFDVGGTSVKYAVVNEEGEKIFDSSSSILFVGTNGPDKRSEALTGKITKQLVINW